MKGANSPKSNLGRPRGQNNKIVKKTFRFTEEEWNYFEENFVKSAFSSKVEYILSLVRSKPGVKKQNVITFDTYSELKKLRVETNKIGVNINQVATKIHTLGVEENTILGYSLGNLMDELTKIKSLYEEYSSVLTKEIEKEINK
jgi:hypothetical protein